MSTDKELLDGKLMIGTKQTTRALELALARELYVAKDADPRITSKVINLAKKQGVPVRQVETMKLLGKACGIEVGAAMAAVIQE